MWECPFNFKNFLLLTLLAKLPDNYLSLTIDMINICIQIYETPKLSRKFSEKM
jgi:hypothetical protein